MSLLFGIATTDKVAVSNSSSIQSLAQWTSITLLYATSIVSAAPLWDKRDNAGNNGPQIRLLDALGNLRLGGARATTQLIYASNNAPIKLRTWTYVAGVCDITNNIGHVYAGPTPDRMVECTYGTAQGGSGTVSDDSANAFNVGANIQGPQSFSGIIACIAHFNYAMRLEEIKKLAYFNQPTARGCVLFLRLGYGGVGTQIDQSGNANHGTITGARMAADPPPVLSGKRPWSFGRVSSTPIDVTLSDNLPSSRIPVWSAP